MEKEATPRSGGDDEDWLRPYYEQAGSAAGGAKVDAFHSRLRGEHAARPNERRAVVALLAAAALGLAITTAAILIGYTRGPQPAAAPNAAEAAQRRPAISPLDMTRERGANFPVARWHSAF